MRNAHLMVAVGAMLLGAGAASGAEPCVWIEGEKPDSANFEYKVWGGDNPEVLSGGQWLHLGLDPNQIGPTVPADGLKLAYAFQAAEAGRYAIYLRVGFEFIRAPLEWRLDTGQWQKLPGDIQTTDLMNVAEWCEVAWVKAGDVELAAGEHDLEISYREAGSDGRLLIGLDCIALSKGPFVPDGALQPGQQYDEPADRQARQNVFRLTGKLPDDDAERVEISLDGLWQVARYDDPDMDAGTYEPIKTLPKPADYPLRWRALKVPGDARQRPELVFGHRLLYRTRVEVPAALAGRSFHLSFGGTCWIASVFVNGQYVGGHQSVLVPWDMDVTEAVKPGQVNTITIGIKSSWYALDPSANQRPSLDHIRNMPYGDNVLKSVYWVAAVYPSTGGEGDGREVGIVFPVSLVAAGRAYTSDIFVRTSVAEKKLDADVTVTNPTAAPETVSVLCEAVHDKSGKVEKAFGPVEVTIAPRQSKVVALSGAWQDPKLWWPDEDAELYVMRTTVSRNGRPIDFHDQLFGFRELSISGKDFLLNGIPWHFWNWGGVGQADTPEEWLRKSRAQNDRFNRKNHVSNYANRLWGSRQACLEFFDRHGVPGRLSTCINGMFISHDLTNPLVWRNFEHHTRQVVRAYRNHPSIMMYSIGNEMIYIAGRLRYRWGYEKWERNARHLHEVARELDPTRYSFQDGAGDLGGLDEMSCQHYRWPQGGDVPARLYAYRLRVGEVNRARRSQASDFELYAWDGKRPLILGEEFYYSGNVSAMAWIGGPDVFRGKVWANRAAARYARLGIEGARWQGATAICPSVGGILSDAFVSFEPRAALLREWNSCFYPDSIMKRTVKVFNDGHSDDPLTLKWRLMLGGVESVAGQKTYRVPPGRDVQDTLAVQLPTAAERRDGALELQLYAGAERVFSDTKPVTLLPRPPAVAGLADGALGVLDPEGSARKWLDEQAQQYATITAGAALPQGVRVILIGRNALTGGRKPAVASALKGFVLAGNTAIVLEQNLPLEGGDLPVAGIALAGGRPDEPIRPEFRAAGGKSGAIAFPVAAAHPVLRDLRKPDFFTWAGDETSFRLSYASPSSGVVMLVQAGDKLGLSPMIEIPVGQGSYLLSQMLVGEKLGADPVADRLLYNALAWAAERAGKEPGVTRVWPDGDAGLTAFLAGLPVEHEVAGDLNATLARDTDIAIVRASAAVLGQLQQDRAAVRAVCNEGGWLMLVGLGPEGLASFNDLVGVQHRIRPFRREAVVVQARTDPLLMGLSDRDVNMVSDQMLAPWMNLRWVSDRTFTRVVDGREIASFAAFANEYLTKLANGLTNDDFWQYICYFGEGEQTPSVDFKFGRPETFTRINIWSNESYYFPKDIELVFDGDEAGAPKFTLEQRKSKQELTFDTLKASTVTLRIMSKYPSTSQKDLTGIDLVEIYRQVPDDFDRRVVLLTKPGGLVKYPIGKGGILLNQIDYASEDTSENVRKKLAIYSNVLRNMGASFRLAAGRQ